jgi:hypothetical protein
MAVALAISDGTTTVSLSGTSPVLGVTYFPQTSQYRNGEWQNVTEDAEVNLRGTHTAIRAAVASIELLLQAAIRRQETGVGDKVYVTFAPLSETAYRSEVFDGRVVWSTDPGLRRLGDTNPTVRIDVIWTRAPGWDGDLTQISLSASGQSASTSARTITNDPANGNWVQMAAAQVTGDMPTPVMLELTNASGGAQAYRKLFVNVNAGSDPANLVHYLQAEAAVSGGTAAADATCSGGNRWSVTLSTTPTTYQWTLPAADMQRTKGRRARITARIKSIAGATYVRPKILDSGGAQVLWSGDELYLGSLTDTVLLDLGIVPLPPGGYGATYAAHRLGLEMRSSGAPTDVFDVFQLTMLDAYLYADLNSVSVANGAALVLDGVEGRNYISASSVWTPLATSFGGPIMLQPNTLQRIHVLYEIAATAGVPITGTFGTKAYFRPRRLTV